MLHYIHFFVKTFLKKILEINKTGLNRPVFYPSPNLASSTAAL